LPAGLVEVTSRGFWLQGVTYSAGLLLQAGGWAPTMVSVQTPPPVFVNDAPSGVGSKVVPLSSLYGCSTIDVTAGSVVVAVSTRRCLPIRYSAGVITMFVVTAGVTTMVTLTGFDVPPWFVALTL